MPLILIADDPGLLGETERTFLDREGFVLMPVRKGEEPLGIARQNRPDLAVLAAAADPLGVDTCARFKADPDLQGIPLILVGSMRQKVAALAAGAEGFISRPVTRASLLSQVRRFFPTAERAAQRCPVGIKVLCRSDGESVVAFTRDLSASGLFVKSPRPPATGSRLIVEFVLPLDRPLRVASEAEVVRSVPPDQGAHATGGAGLRFTSLPAETRIEIGRFVRTCEGGA